jgi:apolipoprotein N-acyltransferase
VWFLLCAAAWVAWEMVIARIFGGFPWNLLGASQYRLLPVIQIASVTGVYGVSFLVAWFSASMFAGVLLLVRHPERATLWRRTLVFPALILVAVAGSGFVAVLSQPAQPRHLRVALIQPSIPQTVIFDPEGSEERFEILLRLTTEALAAGPDIVIWPEASLPGGLRQEDMDRLRGLIRTARVWMVFGADDVEEAPGAGDESIPFRAFNSAFLMDPRGEVIERYRKRRLVMFGEYIPLSRWLPFLKRLAPIGDGFHPGERPVSFVMAGLDATTSALICFEDNFPHLARQHATRDVDFLLNLTNDAWFGRSSAQWQHAANAVFRAIENGIPLVRCANNGLSCWVDATGRMHSARLAAGGNVYDAGFEIATLAFGQPLPTFYRKIGDVFGWACVLATVTGLALRLPPASAARGSRRDPGSGD